MQYKTLSFAALLGLAAAQNQGLNATLSGNNQTSTLAGVIAQSPQLASSIDSLRNVTVLAPSNAALAAILSSPQGAALTSNPDLLAAVLTYHIINGTYRAADIKSTPAFVSTLLTDEDFADVEGGQVVEAIAINNGVSFFSGLLQNSTVVQADIAFNGGVIHVIDRVLTVPENVTATALASNLTVLAGALNQTKLAEAVDTTADLTIFAPNNAAFQAIGSAVNTLTTEQLSSILTYHVVNGSVAYSTDLSDNQSLQTLNGRNVTINIEGSNVFVNGARVIQPNVLVANGVVHVIDNVLNPDATTATPSASATAGSPAFSGASSASDISLTSGQATPTTTVSGGSGGGAATSSVAGAGVAMQTAAVGAAVLFGAGAALLNY